MKSGRERFPSRQGHGLLRNLVCYAVPSESGVNLEDSLIGRIETSYKSLYSRIFGIFGVFLVRNMGEVNTGCGWARARLSSCDSLESMELSVLQKRMHTDKSMDLPGVGEPMVMMLGRRRRGHHGVMYSGTYGVPQTKWPDVDDQVYEDGTVLRYGCKEYTLTARSKGKST